MISFFRLGSLISCRNHRRPCSVLLSRCFVSENLVAAGVVSFERPLLLTSPCCRKQVFILLVRALLLLLVLDVWTKLLKGRCGFSSFFGATQIEPPNALASALAVLRVLKLNHGRLILSKNYKNNASSCNISYVIKSNEYSSSKRITQSIVSRCSEQQC